MKKLTTLTLIGASALSLAAGAAAAQPRYDRPNDGRYETRGPWMSIDQRQAELEQRIQRGVQSGDLTRREARRLQREFYQLAQLERQYRRNGLSGWERNDLDRRFDLLSAKIRYERHDREDRRDDHGDHRYDHDGRR
jgi:hypothetical protein